MLGLKLETDHRWAYLAENNLQELLTDHAFCEQKAASNAISIIVKYPELSDLVDILTEIAQEELSHFKRVHQLILARGWVLGPDRKDSYVNDLLKMIRKGINRETTLVDRLLFAAMIEARSCERFKLLTSIIRDEELSSFYHELMISEANHYVTFIKLAKQYSKTVDVNARWQEFLEHESKLMLKYGRHPTIHG